MTTFLLLFVCLFVCLFSIFSTIWWIKTIERVWIACTASTHETDDWIQVERTASTPQWRTWWRVSYHLHRSRWLRRLQHPPQHRLLQLRPVSAVHPVRFQHPRLASRCWREASLCRKESSAFSKRPGVATATSTASSSSESTANRLAARHWCFLLLVLSFFFQHEQSCSSKNPFFLFIQL